jgi:hypothetical protein
MAQLLINIREKKLGTIVTGRFLFVPLRTVEVEGA